MTALFASRCCASNPGETILYDVRASWAVPDLVAAPAGSRWSTASAIRSSRQRMRDEGARLRRRGLGHYYFRDFSCADSGTIPFLLMLEVLSQRGLTLSELLAPLRRKLLHLRRDQHRGSRPARQDRRDRRALSDAQADAASTASRSTPTTGTSTSAARTPSRCCASTSNRSSRKPTWRPSATRCSR